MVWGDFRWFGMGFGGLGWDSCSSHVHAGLCQIPWQSYLFKIVQEGLSIKGAEKVAQTGLSSSRVRKLTFLGFGAQADFFSFLGFCNQLYRQSSIYRLSGKTQTITIVHVCTVHATSMYGGAAANRLLGECG